MEWINSDVPGDESPHCSSCGRQIGIASDAIAIRVGSIKDRGRLYEFSPRLFDDRTDVRWFHFSCLELVFDFSEAEGHNDPTDCAFCPEDLLGEAECYEFELGHFELREEDTWWEESRDLDGAFARICVCLECVEASIGEGDTAEMRRQLGKDPLPEDDHKWINYNNVPKSTIEEGGTEVAVPPHLKKRGRRPPSVRR